MTAASHAVWGDLLGSEDVAALDPGLPDGFGRRPDVLVIGGGIVGVTVAVACQQAGLGQVMVLETATLGAGATGGAAGLVIPDAHQGADPDWFVDLARRSLVLWRELEQRHGVGLVDLDWIALEPQPPEFRSPASAEALTAPEIAAMVPGLAYPAAGLRLPDQARLNPLRAVARLSSSIHRVATGVTVTGVIARRGRISELVTSAGSVMPGVVVFATGGPPALHGLGLDLPARPIKGHLLVTEPASFRLPGAVAPVATPLEDGSLLVGGTLDLSDPTPDVDPEVVASIHAGLREYLPATADLAVTHAWCCFRPAHPDGLPVIDRIPGLSNAWVTSGHYRTGILMAPITGELLTTWINTGAQPPEAAQLDIARLRPR
jgi:glycine oxidase